MEDTEEYLEKLRAVFEVFDTEKKGFISVERFVQLAGEHFGAEETQSQVGSHSRLRYVCFVL